MQTGLSRMRRAAALVAALALTSIASADQFIVNMLGANEIPPADPNGTCIGVVNIDTGTNTISWDLAYTNLAPLTTMHIHTGAAGVSGPVLFDMGIATTGGAGTLIQSKPAPPATIAQILADPAGFYVNLHTSEFPAGAVRGQLIAAPDTQLVATLTGANEVPPSGSAGTASATFTFDAGAKTIGWNVTYTGLSATVTASHIHTGVAGQNGGVLINIGTAPGAGTIAGSAPTTGPNIARILLNPSGFYYNIHTSNFPGGEIRGQLEPAPTCTSDLDGNGAVDGADLGILLGNWGGTDVGDFDNSGTVDGADLGTLLGSWGDC
ncbi:MAG: CHRD domain-containing protein [Phycisphaerae bacterium]|nr:CHRD domain-containing protein [Phycisphaerae bacterium]